MGRSASRVLFLATLIGLSYVSLRPVALVDLAIDVVLMPVRVLAELVRPARLLRARSVHAADSRLRELEWSDREARAQLLGDSIAYVVPDRPELTVGRQFVHAEVLERVPGDVDRLIVQVESGSCQGLEPGQPVISGEFFVGRVFALDDPQPGLATIDLVTREDFVIGGRVEPAEGLLAGARSSDAPAIRLVVGGVHTELRNAGPRGARDLFLAVHNPSRRHSAPGRVVVDEGDSGGERFREQSQGFLLGATVASAEDNEQGEHALEHGLTPFLDYAAGLFQVAIVCAEGVVREPEHALPDLLEDQLWRRVGATSVGDPSRWREGQKLAAGRLSGVRTGAAVASGVRLVGRVRHAGLLTADVALLGDPGLWVPAIAQLEGHPEPLVLGRLVSLGRETSASGGEVILFHWDAVVPLEALAPGDLGAGSVRAVLYTGSGEPLVPRGSLLGEVDLPRGPGPHVLRVEEPVDTRRLGTLWVRLPALASHRSPAATGAERAP